MNCLHYITIGTDSFCVRVPCSSDRATSMCEDPGDQDTLRPPDFSDEDLETLRKIRIIHRNLGHPSQNVMLRMFRTAQVPERVIEIAKRFECDACKTQRHSIPKLPACPPAVTEKWNTVSIDTFWWTNPTRTLEDVDRCVVGISFMDEATDLHVASIVRENKNTPGNLSGDEFIQHFCQTWLRCLPKPQRLRCDVEKCFEGDKVLNWLEESTIKIDMVPGEAPWQLGKHSRHLHTLKQQMSKSAFELGPDVTNEEIISLCLSAKHEVRNCRGYSPNQWAFGQNSERVFSFLDMYRNLPSMNESHPSFEENIEKVAKAREIFIQCDSAKRIKRAALHQSRRNQHFEVGTLVFYYRKGRGKGERPRGQWYGPGRVVCIEKTTESERGREGSIVWITHGTRLLRCAPEQLQRVSRDLNAIDFELRESNQLEDLIKTKKQYFDLRNEAPDLEVEVHERDDLAWRVDPHHLEFEHDTSRGPDQALKRQKLLGKQSVDPRVLDSIHVEPVRESRPDEEVEGSGRDSKPGAMRNVSKSSRT